MIDEKEVAKALDEWFRSQDGKQCLDHKILYRLEDVKYLENRLHRAFLAGVAAAECIIEKQHEPRE